LSPERSKVIDTEMGLQPTLQPEPIDEIVPIPGVPPIVPALAALGRSIRPPWDRDQKVAALAGWVAAAEEARWAF